MLRKEGMVIKDADKQSRQSQKNALIVQNQ